MKSRVIVDQIENAIKRGCAFGDNDWVVKFAVEFELELALKLRGIKYDLKKGMKGTILYDRYKDVNPFAVEVFDFDGNEIGVFDIDENDLEHIEEWNNKYLVNYGR